MTADMQINKIIVNIIFTTPDLRTKFIPILSFMHFLVDFVSCVGTLMSGSGLKSKLCGTFESVEKMLEGKKYPQNICALCLLTEEIIRPINEPNNMAGLENTWWRHQMETFSALLAICAGNSPVPGEFPTQRPVTRSFDIYFDLRPNKRLSKQSWGWWFETLLPPLWHHRNDFVRTFCLKSNNEGMDWISN